MRLSFLPLAATLLTSAALLSACTQSPATIHNRGVESYVRGGISTATTSEGYSPYTSGMTVPGDAQRESAEVPAVTIDDLQPIVASDLPPPAVAAPVDVAPTVQEPPLTVQNGTPVVSSAVTTYETNPSQTLGSITTSGTTPPVAATSSVVAGSSAAFIWPVRGQVIAPYGKTPAGVFNDGINIAATQGEPVVAAADGEVVYSGNELRGYGNMVILKHQGNIMTAYAHADRILVDKGQQVRQGVAIATVGKSGGVEQAQLHFGVRVNKEPVDPIGYLTN